MLAVVTLLIGAALGDEPAPSYPRPAPADQQPSSSYHEPAYPDTEAAYNFDWKVYDDYSNNNFGHNENRAGKSTAGSYYVALPDGRTQKVTYSVDGYGGK